MEDSNGRNVACHSPSETRVPCEALRSQHTRRAKQEHDSSDSAHDRSDRHDDSSEVPSDPTHCLATRDSTPGPARANPRKARCALKGRRARDLAGRKPLSLPDLLFSQTESSSWNDRLRIELRRPRDPP